MVENHALFASIVIEEFLHEHDVEILPTIASTVLVDLSEVDAVLVDYDLDDGKGDQVVRWLRVTGFAGKIIAISAHAAGNEALVEAGADAVCRKLDFASIGDALRDDP